MTQGIVVLGSTGSIGINTLDVIALHPNKFHVSALSANTDVERLFLQCQKFRPEQVVMVCESSARQLQKKIKQADLPIEVSAGIEALNCLAKGHAKIIVCGIVGAAGLHSTIAAVQSGKKVLIANKEPIVMLGHYIVALAAESGAQILPLDSEHNAIFQCLPISPIKHNHPLTQVVENMGVKRLLLTGSGGPFRQLDLIDFKNRTPAQACAHPNWLMGAKISVDSATMMNKGLEIIEACVLFGLPVSSIDIVVHPQSVIHSMVEFIDGSILAQMASPDMRVPIANALAWPRRIVSGAKPVNLFDIGHLDFEPPDPIRFPMLSLAKQAAEDGGYLPAVMNAANEIAVAAFLAEQLTFDQIVVIVERTMQQLDKFDVESKGQQVEQVLELDQRARAYAQSLL